MKKTDNKIPVTKILVLVLLFILIASSVLFVISLWERQQRFIGEDISADNSVKIELDGEEYMLKSNLESILIMGLDKFESSVDTSSYSNDQQADFLMLVVLDNKNRSWKALHINRDTMTEMSVLGVAGMEIGKATQQLALAHTYGNGESVSCRNTAKAVSNLLLGNKVDHYLSLTLDSVPVFNDLVGGVTLEVLDDFTGIDDTLIKGDTVTLNGEQALHYVRSRYGMDDSTNAARMVRQRQYLNSLYDSMRDKAENDEEFIIDSVEAISDYMVSDCYVQDLKDCFEKMSKYEYMGLSDIEGESVRGELYMEFYPDKEALNRTVADLFYTKID